MGSCHGIGLRLHGPLPSCSGGLLQVCLAVEKPGLSIGHVNKVMARINDRDSGEILIKETTADTNDVSNVLIPGQAV